MANENISPKVSIDDIVEAAAHGVLRALQARQARAAELSVPELVRAGFVVDVIIRAGGIPAAGILSALNPQPLPPVHE
jgi:hypothetical protein